MTGGFYKMHGLGNDFVVIDAREVPVAMSPGRARSIADRRTGIGCDQVIVLDPSPSADARMRTWNPDGSEAEICGNATRAVAVLLGHAATLETAGGTVGIAFADGGATIDMGQPKFAWDAVPLAYPMDTAAMPVAWNGLATPAAVNVGNPHVVFFVDDCDAINLETCGPAIETDPLFPARINVNVATITGPRSLRLRVWERGTGLTRACGTGACATAVIAIRQKRVTSPVTVTLPGGDLVIDWTESEPIRMTGPAVLVFTGQADWDRFGA
ncbi:MAG: diaminopimelate epimerase [Sphingomonadaceae bacterium]